MSQPAFLIDSDEDLTRDVARLAGTAEIGGRRINAGGLRASVAPTVSRVEPAQLPPPAPVVPGMGEADVRRLIDERDTMWRDLVDSMQRQIDLLAARTNLPRKSPVWRMRATYLADGCIDELVATPEATP